MSTGSAPSSRCRTITTLTAMLHAGLLWQCLYALLSCDTTWPMEEIPHDDVAKARPLFYIQQSIIIFDYLLFLSADFLLK